MCLKLYLLFNYIVNDLVSTLIGYKECFVINLVKFRDIS